MCDHVSRRLIIVTMQYYAETSFFLRMNEWEYWPVFDAEGGLEELELSGDPGATPLRDLVQVHQRRPADQLRTKIQRLTETKPEQ